MDAVKTRLYEHYNKLILKHGYRYNSVVLNISDIETLQNIHLFCLSVNATLLWKKI
jgi:hypothetical protein